MSASLLLESKRCSPAAVLEHVRDGDEVIVGLGNGAPQTVLDELEAGAGSFRDVRLHQMLPLRPRRYIEGELPGLRHVSWFLSEHDRAAFRDGACDLVPNDFSQVPQLLRRATRCSLVLAAVSPPDRHGYFSLGCHAEYVAAFIGEVPFFVEANQAMPRTFGENQVHVSDVVGWCEADYPLVEVPSRSARPEDERIAALVAERIPDGATLQAGIGAIPNAILSLLGDSRDLGVHTELLSDGFVDLVERGAVTGTRKRHHRNTIITTSAIGTKRVHEFVSDNAGIEFWPVDYTNDPGVIARERSLVAVNATLEVDFLGQCASESIGSDYVSSSGGQADFARGAMFAEQGRSFTVLHSTTHDESVSRIVPRLHPGAAITTPKNVVDCIATEWGVAELRGTTIRERARRLIAIAHPSFREDLEREAHAMGYR